MQQPRAFPYGLRSACLLQFSPYTRGSWVRGRTIGRNHCETLKSLRLLFFGGNHVAIVVHPLCLDLTDGVP